jgi:hypothetical protein
LKITRACRYKCERVLSGTTICLYGSLHVLTGEFRRLTARVLSDSAGGIMTWSLILDTAQNFKRAGKWKA